MTLLIALQLVPLRLPLFVAVHVITQFPSTVGIVNVEPVPDALYVPHCAVHVISGGG